MPRIRLIAFCNCTGSDPQKHRTVGVDHSHTFQSHRKQHKSSYLVSNTASRVKPFHLLVVPHQSHTWYKLCKKWSANCWILFFWWAWGMQKNLKVSLTVPSFEKNFSEKKTTGKSLVGRPVHEWPWKLRVPALHHTAGVLNRCARRIHYASHRFNCLKGYVVGRKNRLCVAEHESKISSKLKGLQGCHCHSFACRLERMFR